MSELNLVCFDFEECYLNPQLKSHLCELLPTKIQIYNEKNYLSQYYHKERQQYDAGKMIEAYDIKSEQNKTILITSVDLYIPIFTYVFGLAKLNGNTGIVSTHRLRSDFYGLPKDENLLVNRLIKEIVHELGHLCNLRHCTSYICVMASSTSVDDLDIKQSGFCQECRKLILNQGLTSSDYLY
jgi:archaemetzincin